eukprot:10959976-Ditylum_brightwellii.AAC.1
MDEEEDSRFSRDSRDSRSRVSRVSNSSSYAEYVEELEGPAAWAAMLLLDIHFLVHSCTRPRFGSR